MVFIGAGEGAALVAEQFGFEQGFRYRRAVLDHEGAVGARAGVVDGARQQFLAGAGFAQHQHRQVVARDPCGHFAHAVHRAAGGALDAVEAEGAACALQLVRGALAQHRRGGAQFEVEAGGFLLQRLRLGGIAHGGQQVVRHPGLQDVLVDAGVVDAGDDVFRVGVAGNDDAHDVRPALAHLFQEHDAGQAGHALVAQNDVHLVPLELGARVVGTAGGEHDEILFQRAAHRVLRAHFVIDHQHGGQAQAGVHRAATSRCTARWRGVQACGSRCTK